MYINIEAPSDSIATLSSIILYSGDCNSLTGIDNFNSGSNLVMNNLIINNTYLIKCNINVYGGFKLNICDSPVHGLPPSVKITINSPSYSYNRNCMLVSEDNWPFYQNPTLITTCNTIYACAGDQAILEVINPRPASFWCGEERRFYFWQYDGQAFQPQTNLPLGSGPPVPNPTTCNSLLPGTYFVGIHERFVVWHPWQPCYIIAFPDGITNYKLVVLDDSQFSINIEPEICVGDDVEFAIPEGYQLYEYSYYSTDDPSNITTVSDINVPTHFSMNIPTCGNYVFTAKFVPVTEEILITSGCGFVTKTANIHIGLDPQITFTESCYGEPTQFTGTACPGVTSWTWDFGDTHKTYMNTTNITSVATSNIYKPNSQYNTYLQVGNGIPECLSSTSVHVNFLPYPDKPEILGNRNNCSTTSIYTLNSVDETLYYSWSIKNQNGTFVSTYYGYGIGTVTINWNSSLPVNNPDYEELIVQVVNSDGCINSDTLKIFQCCQGETIIYENNSYSPVQLDNTTLTTAFPSINQYSYYGQIVVNGDLIVDKNFSFVNDNHIKFGPQAKVIIQPGFTLTFSGSNLSQQCDYMWDGIYLDNSTSQVIITDASTMKDAINGIVSTNGGSFILRNSYFYNNYTALQVKNHYELSGGGNWQPIDATIFSCTFTNNETNHLLTIKPFVNKRSKTGIDIRNIQGMTIGVNTNTAERNTFSYMNNGIIATNSQVTVQNNLFNNIFNTVTPPAYQVFSDAGIVAINTNTSNIQSTSTIIPKLYVGGAGTRKNLFQNCKFGIFNYNQKANVLYNEFTDCQNGVQLLDAKSPSYVQHNILTRSIPEQYGTGIFAENTNLKPHDEIRITENIITNMEYGIRTINLRSGKTIIHMNTISYTAPQNPQAFQVKKCGIFTQGCDYISIRDNEITYAGNPGPDNNLKKIGIRVTHSRLLTVYENSILNAGSGIYTNGNLKNTQFICNVMDNCNHGFFFGELTSLSNQGYNYISNISGFNTHNSFIGNYLLHNKLFANKGNIVNIDPVNWFTYSNYGDNYKLDVPPIPGTNYAYNSIQEIFNDNAYNICSGYGSGSSDFDTLRREQLLGDILRNEEIYKELNLQYRYYDINHLYYLLLNDTAALSLGGIDDDDYIAMYDSLSDANPGIIEKYYQKLEECNFEDARQVSQGIVNDNIYTDNRKAVNNLYLDSWAKDLYDLDSLTTSALFILAIQIPYYAGDAVYTARAMLGINPDDLDIPYNLEFGNSAAFPSDIRLYPQPSDNLLTVELSGFFEEGIVIEVFDLAGQKVFSDIPGNKTNIYTLNTGILKSGAYFIKVTNSNGFNQTEKFIVTH